MGDACDSDSDGDGLSDANDLCSLGDTGWTSDSTNDNDGDGCQDWGEDDDDDNDGVLDINDAFPMDSTETSDFDGDGLGDNQDQDDDNDGYSDEEDAYPLDPNQH
ncbi:MAG: hypothetical protein HOM19_00080 [Candidatus Marinimicrobia bacterium]|nr:hypothetical protein [Candidatus Neomarinimicrobiota bacterium]